jgi:hypothetical protein
MTDWTRLGSVWTLAISRWGIVAKQATCITMQHIYDVNDSLLSTHDQTILTCGELGHSITDGFSITILGDTLSPPALSQVMTPPSIQHEGSRHKLSNRPSLTLISDSNAKSRNPGTKTGTFPITSVVSDIEFRSFYPKRSKIFKCLPGPETYLNFVTTSSQ